MLLRPMPGKRKSISGLRKPKQNRPPVSGILFSVRWNRHTISCILRQVYHGGNGMVTEHGRISAWYAEDGILFAPGGSARYTRIAQVMSWEDAARRIGELLESGQFMSVIELATAPAHERAMIAQRLWYLYGDTRRTYDF